MSSDFSTSQSNFLQKKRSDSMNFNDSFESKRKKRVDREINVIGKIFAFQLFYSFISLLTLNQLI